MTEEEIKKVQELVNEQIRKNLPVSMEITDLEGAKAAGATALFGEKYESQVKVYTTGLCLSKSDREPTRFHKSVT